MVLDFWLFGPFRIYRGEERLDDDLYSPRVRTLLAAFLTERDRYIRAERLVEAFWSHLPPDSGLNNLQVAVGQLRRWLEPSLGRGGQSRYLKTEPGGYRFHSAGCGLDVERFWRALQRGRAARRRGELETAVKALEAARRLVRGEYLSDLPYDDWFMSARERLREAHLELLGELSELHLETGRYPEALEAAREGLAADPLRETFARLAARAHHARGETAEALEVLTGQEEDLEREIGVGASAESRVLQDALRSGRLETLDPISPAVPPPFELPLVGRAAALQALERAGGRENHLTLITGPAGYGKTRLLTEYAAAREDVIYLALRHGERPFDAALQILAACLPLGALARIRPGLAEHAAALGRAEPVLSNLWPGKVAVDPLDPESEQDRLRLAVRAALAALAGTGLILALDDLHLADRETVEVLGGLFAEGQARFLAAYRPEEAGDEIDRLTAAAGQTGVVRAELNDLSREEVLEALRLRLQLPDPAALSEHLYRATSGHPLFLAETVRGLIDAGWLYRDPDGRWQPGAEQDADELARLALSVSLREAILDRAGQLPAVEREVLDACAVLGELAGASRLASMLSISSAEVRRAAAGLTGRRLLVRAENGWRIAHQLVQQALLDALPGPQRRLLHRLAAAALTDLNEPQATGLAAIVLSHLQQGGSDQGTITRWALRAGDWAYAHFAHDRAVEYYELAADGASGDPDFQRELALEAHRGLGLARRQIGDLKGAVQALDKAVEGTRRPAVRIDLLLTQAEILERDAGHFEQALALLDEVETAIPDLPPNDRAAPRRRVLTTRSGIHYWQGDYPRGEALAREALELAEDRDGLSQARQVLAINLQRLGRQSEAISLYQAILADLETRDNRRRQAQGYINLGNGLQAVGRLQEALEAFERAREIAGLLGNRRVLSVVATNLGSLSALIRPLREAESEQRLAIELAEEVGARYTAAHARYHLGMVLALQGHWRQAQEAIDESIRFAEEIAARVMIAQAHLVWGLYLAWPRGDWTESERRGRLALEIGEEQGDNFCRREARLLLGRLSLRAGDPERALAWAQEAHELATRAEQRISIGRAERLLGQIAAVAGLLEDAEAHFHAALEIFEGCAAGLERGRTLLARARAWRSWGEAHDRSQADVESAAGLFRKSGAAPLLAEALSFLRDESDDDR